MSSNDKYIFFNVLSKLDIFLLVVVLFIFEYIPLFLYNISSDFNFVSKI
ncbi:hypothetical protein HOG21_01185 [bacterium]|nr:hypothetical protein [bacterium]